MPHCSFLRLTSAAALALAGLIVPTSLTRAADGVWEPAGWGGGGYYYAAAFDPVKDGVLYLAGDVAGVYKSEDHGKSFHFINKGIAAYGIFSLAVDPRNSQNVYAATEEALCKSTDGGENWQILPQTGKKELRITGEKGKSIRAIAVDPTDSNTILAASPGGKVYKSIDGGQTWKATFGVKVAEEADDSLKVQYGKVNEAYFGGIWTPLVFPVNSKSSDCVGFGITFAGDGSQPKDCFATLTTSAGVPYRSKNLSDEFAKVDSRDIILRAEDFIVEPEWEKKHADAAKTLSGGPDWATVVRVDLGCSGPLPTDSSTIHIGKFFFAMTSLNGQTGTAEAPIAAPARSFSTDKAVQSYGNIRVGNAPAGAGGGSVAFSVAIAPKDPNLAIAATSDAGLVMSEDKGETWTPLSTPKKAASATFDPADSNVIYGAFFGEGLRKSTDKGKTWSPPVDGIPKQAAVREIVVSPANSQDVYAIAAMGWGGAAFISHDGGATWKTAKSMKLDKESDPTMQNTQSDSTEFSSPTNLTINPRNPKELFFSGNWRCGWSGDAGVTWAERNKGADISCVTDIRFSEGRTYVTAMDEGTFLSPDQGASWKQLWPLKYEDKLSGHNWRVAVDKINGLDRIITAVSPWSNTPNRIIRSDDGGKTYTVVTEGLPDYIPKANTMWGQGYARALAVDPKNPQIVYLGIDGDPEEGKSGGGLFKSEDGGATWKQMVQQPASRRMYYGLSIDPTDSQRIYWGTCGKNGGVHRTEDGGATWKNVFTGETWIFNTLVTKDGTVYASGKDLWRSTDHGATWQQVTKNTKGQALVGIEVDPRDAKTMWVSYTTWDGAATGGIFKTTDNGVTWNNVTGNVPYIRPQILRFNPATNELWSGYVGLFKMKQ